jgi:transcriptional antiterminator NusG
VPTKDDMEVTTGNEQNKGVQATEERHPDAHWYALQVYSGHENKVRNLLDKRIAENTNTNVIVHQVLVPTQEVMEIKQGKKTRVTKNLYPGYILVEAVMNDETQYFINSINGIIKFLGAGSMPQPLRDREVNKILGRIDEVKEPVEDVVIPFVVGDAVDVTEGPFSDFSGTVEEVYHDKGKVKVTVSLFGRPTSVELDYLQLKKT